MATNSKSSIFVDELLPEFLETEGPKFKAFVRAYYEFLETTGQVTERSKNLLNYADISKTNTEFLKYFDREILANFPQEILANKTLVAARIKELYRAKGSEQAYKMLFRMLFDDEIDFYYPNQDILRVSDGRWVQETSIRLSGPFTGDLFQIGGRDLIGTSSGATAIVERVIKTFEQGIEVFELFISNVRGVFEDAEIVETSEGDLSGVILSSVGPLQGVVISFGGSSHRSGDFVTFNSASGILGTGVVIAVEDSSVVPVIIDGGSGFSVNAVVTLTGGSGTGAQFKVDTISNTQVLFGFIDTIGGVENTLIQANTFGSSNTRTISANLAIATSNTVLSAALGTIPITVGTISSMSAITRGSGYANNALPAVQVIEPLIAEQFLDDGDGGIKGFNANVTSGLIGGSIISVGVNDIGAGYARKDPVTIINVTRNAQNAIGAAQVTGIIEYAGKYIDTKGFISWNNRLQDNLYYQQFSYVIRSTQNIDAYREIVKKLLHPAGTNLFGSLSIESNLLFPFSSNTFITYAIEFSNVQPGISSTLNFGLATLNRTVSPASRASTSVVSTGAELVHIIDYSSISPTAIFGSLTLDRTLTANSIVSTVGISNDTLVVPGINPASISNISVFGLSIVDFIIDPNSIAGALVFGTSVLDRTLTVPSVDSTLVFGTSVLDRTLTVPSVDSTLVFGTTALDSTLTATSIDIITTFGLPTLDHRLTTDSIGPTLVFGTTTLDRTLTAASIASTTIVSTASVVYALDPVSITNVVVFGLPTLDHRLNVNSINSTLSFGPFLLEGSGIDVPSIQSTAVVSANGEIANFIGIDPNSIVSTIVIPTHNVLRLGSGTITNFFVNTIQDLSTEQIAKYSNITIDSVPGNRIFDGTGTAFATQLIPTSVIFVIDINNTDEEFILTVSDISGNNALSVTSNVLYSNSSLAIVNNAIYGIVS